ncbi:MAG: putative toxin-antitoxin system toxin component, PIN family [Anaerolineales bacterium]
MLIVLDTNVLVSGLLKPHGPPGQVLDQVLSNTVRVAFDDRILDEYLEVLARPKFHFSSKDTQALIDHIRLNGQQVAGTPIPEAGLPDAGDRPFAEVAISAQADALVTGDLGHFDLLQERGVSVLTPAEFIESLGRLLQQD